MRKHKGGIRSFFIWMLVAAIVIGFLYFENNVIALQELVVSSKRLPVAFSGLRVVELADLHGKEFGEDNKKLLEAVAQAKPDIIAIDGDLADEHTDLSMLRPLAKGLVALAPTYYVTGNHEWVMADFSVLLEVLEDEGVTVLRNEFVKLERNGQAIVVAGADDPNGPLDQKTPQELVEEIRAACGEDSYILMLSHRNDRLDLWAGLGVDTVLTGHGHGGVIRLPFLGGLVGVNRDFFPEYTAGLFEKGQTTMVVSRGLGNSVIHFRLFNRPHLPVVILQ